MEYGIFSLGDRQSEPGAAGMRSEQDRLHRMVRVARVAEEAGFDVFAVGERHAPPFVTSSQAVILAYLAASTSRLKLSTATTQVTTNDPVRLAEEFATLQLLSNDRVDLMLGRGNTPAAYGWFGQNIARRWSLTIENRELLERLWTERRVDWRGSSRAPLEDFEAVPRPLARKPFVWQGTAGSPEAARVAALFGDGFFVNNLFGPVTAFADLIDLFREQWAAAGRPAADARVGASGLIFVRENSQDARREFEAYHNAHPVLSRVGTLDHAIRTTGSIVGSPAEAVDRVLQFRDLFGSYHRQLFNMDAAIVPEAVAIENIALAGEKVLPDLRKHASP